MKKKSHLRWYQRIEKYSKLRVILRHQNRWNTLVDPNGFGWKITYMMFICEISFFLSFQQQGYLLEIEFHFSIHLFMFCIKLHIVCISWSFFVSICSEKLWKFQGWETDRLKYWACCSIWICGSKLRVRKDKLNDDDDDGHDEKTC